MTSHLDESGTYLTTSEFAQALPYSVPIRTVSRWCREGKVHARQTVGGHYRIPVSEVDRLAREWYQT